jgi:hypothetical protein
MKKPSSILRFGHLLQIVVGSPFVPYFIRVPHILLQELNSIAIHDFFPHILLVKSPIHVHTLL